MSGMFPTPEAPHPSVLEFAHEHDLFLIDKAKVRPNGICSSLWACKICPDIFIGGPIGAIPPGYCGCGWVQRKWPRKRCEDCKRPMQEAAS